MLRVLRTAGVLVVALAAAAIVTQVAMNGQAPTRTATTTSAGVTFTKDIAPIFQKSCQNCHRPGQMAPMSLLTYQDVRPWARSIKQRVVDRDMPPWGVDPHVGIQSFKNDPSLRDDEIETIVKWDDAADSNGDDSSAEAGEFLNEFAVGKNGDVFPEGAGRLLKAGSKIRFDFHYHSVGEEITDRSQLGIVFYPKGYTPKHIEYSKQLGQPTEPIDVPGGSSMVRSDGYQRFHTAGRITAFQPHMHTRGKRQCIELIYPDNKTELLSCSNFTFNWHIVHVYADDVAPIYPAGTVLHVISWHDNSARKGNPDPRNWVGQGNRTIDEMGFAWISWYDMTDDEYKAQLDARKGAKRTTTT